MPAEPASVRILSPVTQMLILSSPMMHHLWPKQRVYRCLQVTYPPSRTHATCDSCRMPHMQLPDFAELHALSVSREAVNAVAWNARGDWLALGCARLGQLLVWEWRSQSYVLQQQGHYFDAAAVAFSPDGSLLATGADDAKVGAFALLNVLSMNGSNLPGDDFMSCMSTLINCGTVMPL